MDTRAHQRAQLSAYLDGALAPAERAAVETHLGGCPDCRARLVELRATMDLLRALPDLVPTRRLTPRVVAPPAWLAPLRTLVTFASGLSVFLFIASALVANIGTLTTPSALNAPAAGQAAGGATSASSGPDRADASAPERAVTAAQSPTPAALTDGASKQQASSAPSLAFSAASPAPADARAGTSSAERDAIRSYGSPLATSPWLWLALAVITGAVAIALQRRLRRT